MRSPARKSLGGACHGAAVVPEELGREPGRHRRADAEDHDRGRGQCDPAVLRAATGALGDLRVQPGEVPRPGADREPLVAQGAGEQVHQDVRVVVAQVVAHVVTPLSTSEVRSLAIALAAWLFTVPGRIRSTAAISASERSS